MILTELLYAFDLVVIRFGGRYNYKVALYQTVNQLKGRVKRGEFGGFKIAFTGRFTRRERLTYK